MDSKGAQELARILEERGKSANEPIPEVKAKGAAPIFYWVGVEPPESSPKRDEDG